MAMTSLIPVQNIERVEIVKGAASTAWGAALGGVVNIITKEPNTGRPVSGMVSGSVGSKFTADSRAELSGTVDRLGYYLTAGNIHSDGLTPNTATNLNNLYGKLVYRLPSSGTATIGFSQLDVRSGMDEGNTVQWGWVHDNAENHHTSGFLKFSQPLGAKLTLDLDGFFRNNDDHMKYGGLDGQGAVTFFNDNATTEKYRGANARLTWGDGQHNLVAGVEYGHVHGVTGDLLNPPPNYDLTWDSWGFYANGALTIDRLTIIPGIRYDLTGIAGDITSYSLGATYRLYESTTLRAYGAQGYSLPRPNTNGELQKVKTIQGGIESGVVPYLWLKGTYFFNSMRNNDLQASNTFVNQDRQGFEIEARTTPLYNVSLATGYTYLHAKNADTGEELKTNSDQSVPSQVVKLALNYNKADLGLRGVLTGNYVWWNSPTGYQSESGMIWDLHLNWKLMPKSELSPELFFSGHNLFNGVQTTGTELYTNPSRWYDGGLRVRF